MKEKGTYEMPESVAALGERIGEWRRRGKPRAMPRELWAEAARLGQAFGVYPIARDLNLHYGRLKEMVKAKGVEREGTHETVTHGGFVELRAVMEGGGMETRTERGSYVIEVAVTKPGGAALRIRQSGPEAGELSGMVAAFLGNR